MSAKLVPHGAQLFLEDAWILLDGHLSGDGTDRVLLQTLNPVLDLDEAYADPHNQARGVFVRRGEALHPAPAPRFSRTPAAAPENARAPGSDTDPVLAEWGIDAPRIAQLRAEGAIA